MSESLVQMLRSILASVIGIAGSLLLLAALVEQTGLVDLPSWWAAAIAIITSVATAARTAVAWLDPRNTSFGLTTESLAARRRRSAG
jgi:Na+-translocating ferredoxin:NAD+ oxidoreductase RnfA subunit